MSAVPTKQVSFCLPFAHVDKDSSDYCKRTSAKTDQWITVNTRPRAHNVVAPQPSPPYTNIFALLDDQTTGNMVKFSGTPPQLALGVLDQVTGKVLEHRQLRKHPDYKETWDKSYANKLGRLCQGIGTKPNTPTPATTQTATVPPQLQHVAGTNTMQPIMFHKILPD
jgi:hypothetical protein